MTTPEPEAPRPDGTTDQRITALEHGQVSISGQLERIIGMISGGDAPSPASGPERPEVNIAEEIRQQLDERDRKARKTAEPAAPKAAELAEKPPVAPVRKVTRAIWGDPD